MIFNFGSISDLYNKIKLLTNRVTNTEALDVTQNTRLTTIETINTIQNTRLTNVESVNTAQNTRLTTIESKLIASSKALNTYITLNRGYSLNSGSYIRMFGNVVDMYLLINGHFDNTPVVIGKINDITPLAVYGYADFIVYADANHTVILSINPFNGEMSITLPALYSVSLIKARLNYII